MNDVFKRYCPKCKNEILYKSNDSKNVAQKNKSLCKSCSTLGRKIKRRKILCKKCKIMIDSSNHIRHENSCMGNKKMIRHCPNCNKDIIYNTKKGYIRAINKNCICHVCSCIKKYSKIENRIKTSKSVRKAYKNPIIKENHINGIKEYFERYEESEKYNRFFRFVSKDYYTDIELIVKNILIDNDIEFDHNYKIDKYWVDFLINDNIVIECDGEYWHKDRNKDMIKDNFLIKNGYNVIRFSGNDIKSNINLIKNKIKIILGK